VTETTSLRVGIVMGSRSDMAAADKAVAVLTELGVESEVRVISAHRAPALLTSYAASVPERRIGVLIAIAGLAAHLPGVLAAQTTVPVVGLPMAGGVMDALDALHSIDQKPTVEPVATVGVGNAENAALLSAQILAVGDPGLAQRFAARRAAATQAILDDTANEGL
jgi:phosphoribosylaminoimidazole carboxylase PurE protein